MVLNQWHNMHNFYFISWTLTATKVTSSGLKFYVDEF
jgi:hypothetical protein